ncbi:hypothetical protein [Pseudomonas sp. MWU12-2323]|uniref:hypothetical protein n=1 Tax=Pseudomonas sp. MWU12-2323 TaxID=2651296 RepID=UPI00128D6EA3|nr:hypothetical protein [Pseudomonas sp. MWU12-2323]MPQ69306.1 hypothetical protein [Pseudomonas sp. MWU12-2323]
MEQERVFTELSYQLNNIGVPADQVDCQMFIGNRINGAVMTWVIAVNAASSHAFELPGDIAQEKVIAIAQAVIQWDIAMMEMSPLPEEAKSILIAGARSMLPCSLREMLIRR